jgi:hypothetical protein
MQLFACMRCAHGLYMQRHAKFSLQADHVLTAAGTCRLQNDSRMPCRYVPQATLFFCHTSERPCMLRTVDDICNKMGMRINASNTEL